MRVLAYIVVSLINAMIWVALAYFTTSFGTTIIFSVGAAAFLMTFASLALVAGAREVEASQPEQVRQFAPSHLRVVK